MIIFIGQYLINQTGLTPETESALFFMFFNFYRTTVNLFLVQQHLIERLSPFDTVIPSASHAGTAIGLIPGIPVSDSHKRGTDITLFTLVAHSVFKKIVFSSKQLKSLRYFCIAHIADIIILFKTSPGCFVIYFRSRCDRCSRKSITSS